MKNAEATIASERAAAERDTAARIATARTEAEQAAEQKIALERATMKRESEERIAIERASAEKSAQERIAAAEAERRRALLMSLRQAETLAIAGQLDEANRIYVTLAQSPTSTREAIAAAAAGLYRTGGFAEAVRAFTRLGTFARGEDDLRYYYAVSLYEIGRYAEAKTELAVALPNLQRTDDVERYRAKIEQARR
jgi:Flp pilus assembly protein TadD